MPYPAFHMQTFGCQMNANDSDWLERTLISRGFAAASFEDASLHILNTCSVREKPEQKVYSELGRIARHCKVHKKDNVTVCVGGCVAQQIGPDLAKRFPQVRLIFGTDGVSHAPDAIERLLENPGLRINLLDFADRYEERDDPWLAAESAGADLAQGADAVPPSVFVNIMQGCDNFCAYCIVPYVRGRQKSRDPESVMNECRRLLDKGAREVTLLGQNVNSYGLDGGKMSGDNGDTPFAELLKNIAELPGLERLRFVTPHPKDISMKVIEAFGEHKTLCPRLHLPLQSGSDAVLKRMGRRYTVEKYLDIVKRLRKARPDIMFTTDIIVGFPGETEEDFGQTLEVMREVGFASSFSFVYSDRPGAKAVLFPGKVERGVALERLSRLQAWQNQASEEILARQVGATKTILVEGKSQRDPMPSGGEKNSLSAMPDGYASWQGKTDQGFIVNVPLPSPNERQWSGLMLPVTIQAAARHSLKGKQAGDPW